MAVNVAPCRSRLPRLATERREPRESHGMASTSLFGRGDSSIHRWRTKYGSLVHDGQDAGQNVVHRRAACLGTNSAESASLDDGEWRDDLRVFDRWHVFDAVDVFRLGKSDAADQQTRNGSALTFIARRSLRATEILE